MIALLDTDVLIDVALGRKPFVDHSAVVLDGAERKVFAAFLAWHSLANFYYMVDSVEPGVDPREFLAELLRFVQVSPTTARDARHALNLDMPDLEDALQAAAAVACRADVIVTRNTKHYRNSPVPAMTPASFAKYHL